MPWAWIVREKSLFYSQHIFECENSWTFKYAQSLASAMAQPKNSNLGLRCLMHIGFGSCMISYSKNINLKATLLSIKNDSTYSGCANPDIDVGLTKPGINFINYDGCWNYVGFAIPGIKDITELIYCLTDLTSPLTLEKSKM